VFELTLNVPVQQHMHMPDIHCKCVRAHAHTGAHMCTHIHIHTCTHTHIQTHTGTHTYTHVRTHARAGDSPPVDTLEAAAALVKNHTAIARFALRGPGKPGPRPVSAPLSDPSAISAEEHTAAADMALRHVAHALLVGVEEKQVSEHALQVMSMQPSGPAAELRGGPVVAAAAYLRDRVGVPRGEWRGCWGAWS